MEKLGDYYSVQAAAAATDIKYKTLLKRIERGKVEAKNFGGIKVIHITEVERLKGERAL